VGWREYSWTHGVEGGGGGEMRGKERKREEEAKEEKEKKKTGTAKRALKIVGFTIGIEHSQ